MPNDFVVINQANTNLRVDPTVMDNVRGDVTYILGDLHANGLKLLNFLRYIGVANFSEIAPEDKLWQALGFKPPEGSRNTWYNLFIAIYDKPATFWNDKNRFVYDAFYQALTINGRPKSGYIGDDLYDRGKSDAFIFFFIKKMEEAQHLSKICISNHGAKFIEMRESMVQSANSGVARIPFTHQFFLPGQGASSTGLDHMLRNKAVTWNEIRDIYENNYIKSLVLFDIEDDENGDLRLYTHAPVNEVDILRAALCLIEPTEGHNEAINAADESSIRMVLSHAKGEKGFSLNNTDLRFLRTIVNKAITFHARRHTLTKLLDTTLDENAFGLYFGDGYGKKGTCPYHPTKPLQYILWNRNHPSVNKEHSKVVSSCTFTNIHGHVGEDPEWTDAKYINLDSKLGSVNNKGHMINEKAFTIVQAIDQNTLTKQIANKPCPAEADLVKLCKSILGTFFLGDEAVNNAILAYSAALAQKPTGWEKHVASLQRAYDAKVSITKNRYSISTYESFHQCLLAVESLIPDHYKDFKTGLTKRQIDVLKLQLKIVQDVKITLTRKWLQSLAHVEEESTARLSDEQLAALNLAIGQAYAARFQMKHGSHNLESVQTYQETTAVLVSAIQGLNKVEPEIKIELVNGIKDNMQIIDVQKSEITMEKHEEEKQEEQIQSVADVVENIETREEKKQEIKTEQINDNNNNIKMSSPIIPYAQTINNENDANDKASLLTTMPTLGSVSANALLTPINIASAVMFLAVLSFTIASALTGDIVGFMGTSHVGYNMLSSLAVVLGATAATYCAAYKAKQYSEAPRDTSVVKVALNQL